MGLSWFRGRSTDYVLWRLSVPVTWENYLNGSCLKSFSPGSAVPPDSASQGRLVRSVREIEMKRLFAATAVALALIGGTVTTAQAENRGRNHNQRHDDHRGDRHHDRHDNRHDGHRNNDHRNNHHWDNGHRNDRRYDHRNDWRYDPRDHRRYDRRDWDRNYGFRHYDGRRYDYGRYVRPSGYYYRSWRYGDHLPYGYYSSRYVVNDYHVYHLRPPPYGYHYVRVDHDVVLAAIASGIVVSAVFGIFN
jgi:Ni/Co efflux regulator RcnB